MKPPLCSLALPRLSRSHAPSPSLAPAHTRAYAHAHTNTDAAGLVHPLMNLTLFFPVDRPSCYSVLPAPPALGATCRTAYSAVLCRRLQLFTFSWPFCPCSPCHFGVLLGGHVESAFRSAYLRLKDCMLSMPVSVCDRVLATAPTLLAQCAPLFQSATLPRPHAEPNLRLFCVPRAQRQRGRRPLAPGAPWRLGHARRALHGAGAPQGERPARALLSAARAPLTIAHEDARPRTPMLTPPRPHAHAPPRPRPYAHALTPPRSRARARANLSHPSSSCAKPLAAALAHVKFRSHTHVDGVGQRRLSGCLRRP
eukprot:6195083-Pleurochrysis_carterae.AAC.1